MFQDKKNVFVSLSEALVESCQAQEVHSPAHKMALQHRLLGETGKDFKHSSVQRVHNIQASQ